MGKPLKLVLGLAVAAFVIAWFASPVLAVRTLTKAADERDAATLNRMVDYPAFRASLKEEMSARMLERMNVDGSAREGLSGIGRMLAPALVSGLIDVAITPEVVAAIVDTGEAPDPSRRVRGEKDRADPGEKVRQSWGYRGLNTFAVTLSRAEAPDEKIALLMERRGLFDWKLAGIDLNPDEV